METLDCSARLRRARVIDKYVKVKPWRGRDRHAVFHFGAGNRSTSKKRARAGDDADDAPAVADAFAGKAAIFRLLEPH